MNLRPCHRAARLKTLLWPRVTRPQLRPPPPLCLHRRQTLPALQRPFNIRLRTIVLLEQSTLMCLLLSPLFRLPRQRCPPQTSQRTLIGRGSSTPFTLTSPKILPVPGTKRHASMATLADVALTAHTTSYSAPPALVASPCPWKTPLLSLLTVSTERRLIVSWVLSRLLHQQAEEPRLLLVKPRGARL